MTVSPLATRRQHNLARAGITLLRYTAADVYHPSRLRAEVRAELKGHEGPALR